MRYFFATYLTHIMLCLPSMKALESAYKALSVVAERARPCRHYVTYLYKFAATEWLFREFGEGRAYQECPLFRHPLLGSHRSFLDFVIADLITKVVNMEIP